MRPANAKQAQEQMRKLLSRKIPGRRMTKVKEHTNRALLIADVLYRQFQVGPYQYRLKHLQWYLNIHIKFLAPATQYRYWLTLRIIVKALGLWQKWDRKLEALWSLTVYIYRAQ